jgi:hypothetical protein
MVSRQSFLIAALLIISNFCASFNCYSDDHSVKLPTPRDRTCTAHVKYFPLDTSFGPRDAYEGFVLSNKEYSLFTLWSNESLHVSPVIQFFEQCSVNIIFQNPAPNLKTSVNFLKNMNFYGTGPLHSVYIFMQWNCDDEIEYEEEALGLDLSVYLQYLNRTCESVQKEIDGVFPNFRLLPFRVSSSYAFLLRVPRGGKPESSIFIRKPKLNKNFTPNCISSIKSKYHSYSCLHLREKHKCIYRHFVLSHLQTALNFSCKYINRGDFHVYGHPNPLGFLHFDRSIMGKGLREVNPYIKSWIPEGLTKTLIVYCDFKGSSDRLKIQAWTNPMELHVWIALGVSVLVCAAFSCAFEPNSGWGSNAFWLIGIILRQYSTAIQRSILLTAFGLAALTLTSMYENFITIELIAPTKAFPATDLGQLALDRKYQIYLESFENPPDSLRIEYLNQYLAEDPKKKRLLTEKNVVYFFATKNPTLEELGDMKKKVAFLVGGITTGMETVYLRKVSVINPSRECNYVKIPHSMEPLFAEFRNTGSSEQIKIMSYFLEAGFLYAWENTRVYVMQLNNEHIRRIMDSAKDTEEFDEADEDYLTLVNLVSIFTFWSVVLGFAFVVCLAEVFTMRKSK